MKIAVSGSTGLIGQALVPLLTSGGHTVLRLVRRDAATGEIAWHPEQGVLDPNALVGVDGVVHLAGENIAGRWTAAKKERIRKSRVAGTTFLAERMAACPKPPKVLVCASAIGIYGNRGDQELDEQSPAASDFLAEVCTAWEAAAEPARKKGIRVVHLRFGIVLSARGGALRKMLLPFQLGMGGPIGSGRQFMSWVALDDVVGAIQHALSQESLSGPANTVAPAPVTNREFTRTLGRVLGRPTVLPMPAFAVKLLFGEMGESLLLGGQRVKPTRLLASGYRFRFAELEGALRHVLSK
jgi:uncharacterized protein (TIGR01777 family)